MKKEETSFKGKIKNKHWIIYLGVFVIILLIFFGTNLYLWVKLILGNDIIINVNTDQKNIYLSNDEQKTINVKTSIIANPFCDAVCNYEFSDISNNISLDKQNADIKTLESLKKEYNLIAPSKGTGQVLYRVDVQCKGIKNILCQTSGELNKKTLLVTLDYSLNSQELEEKNSFKESYLEINNNVNEKIYYLTQIKTDLNIAHLDTNYIDNEIKFLRVFSNSTNVTLDYWNKQDYSSAITSLNTIKEKYTLVESDFNSVNATLNTEITKNNQLASSFGNLVNNVSYITTLSLNDSDLLLGEIFVTSTNQIIENLTNNSINSQELSILEVKNQVNSFLSLDRDTPSGEKISITLKDYTPFIINYSSPVYNSTQELKEPSARCCLFNTCNTCCDQSCYDDSTKYPIIFLHGHGFSDSVSPEYNLNIFEELQRSIEDDGYLNAGSLILGSSETNGVLGKPFTPVSLKASYYFDTIQEDGKTNTLYTKKDNVDTYAVRLKDIIEEAKTTTNRDKVILVTHSMGGIVARRYLQIFGDDSVYEVILIASPNHGISKEVYDPCVLFGAREECDDMYESSLLINKLNTQTSLGNTKVYNIIGLGCNTYGKEGDGVVTNSSAYLGFANNYYINGTCAGSFDYFHNSIIDPTRTPQIKELVLELLNKN